MTSSNALKCVVSDYETTNEVAPRKPFNINPSVLRDTKSLLYGSLKGTTSNESRTEDRRFYTNKIGGILMKDAIKMLLSLLIGVMAMGIAKLVHPSWNINHLLIFGLIVFAVTFVLSLLLKKANGGKGSGND